MKQTLTFFAILGVIVSTLSACGAQEAAQAQEADLPEKAKAMWAFWEDRDEWPRYAPGDLASAPGTFVPLRAVYDRHLNLDTDTPLQMRALWEIDHVKWEGEPVVMVAWYSAGDAPPRSSIGYVDPETFNLRYREVSSTRRTTMTIVYPDRVVDHDIEEDGTASSETVEKDHPVFDRWALGHVAAGMELEEGMAFWLKGVYPGSKRLGEYPIRIGARTIIKDTQGQEHEVWPLMLPFSPPWIGYYYVDKEPPYFFGFESRNAATDEVNMRVVLDHFQLLK